MKPSPRTGATSTIAARSPSRSPATSRKESGLITQEDLAAHEGEWVKPLSVPFAGLDLLELPPNTQGITALQMLGMLNDLPLGAAPTDALTVHMEVEVKKLAFADRDAYLTDPAHMRVNPESLISPRYLRQRAALVDAHKSMASIAPGSFTGDTTYMCAADGEGNACSLIQSNYRGFGSGHVVAGTGISLQNRGSYFSLDPERANALAPNKRTLHTLIPSMALRDGRLAIVFGAMGGDGQAQTHTQVYMALARFGLNIQAAIEAPRWVHGAELPGEGEVLRIEDRYSRDTLSALAALGHRVVPVGPWDSLMGHASGIVLDPSGVLHGGSDPRSEGAAVGW